MTKKKKTISKKELFEQSTFTPTAVIRELKTVRWAKFKTTSKDTGLLENFYNVFIFTAVFTAFFELCALISAGILKLA